MSTTETQKTAADDGAADSLVTPPTAEAAPKKKPAAFKPTPTQVPYAKPGEARRLEKYWQRFLSTRSVVTVDEYRHRRSVEAIEEIVPCLLCGSDRFLPMFHPRKRDWEYDVVMCADCDLLYRNPNIIPEHLHVLYDSVNYNSFLSGSYGGGQRQLKYRSVLASFKDVIPPSGATKSGPLKVLDFGCGNGLALEVMQERGYETWGIDLSPESITAAKTRLGHDRLWCGNPNDTAALQGEKFDIITMWSVLAHLPRPIDDLSMLRSYLKPGGKLLVFTVNANSLLLKQDRDTWNGFTRNHLAFYSPKTADQLFKLAGFGEVHHRPHYANHAGTAKKQMPADVWRRWQQSVLEQRGGNMNRMVAVNPMDVDRSTSETGHGVSDSARDLAVGAKNVARRAKWIARRSARKAKHVLKGRS